MGLTGLTMGFSYDLTCFVQTWDLGPPKKEPHHSPIALDDHTQVAQVA